MRTYIFEYNVNGNKTPLQVMLQVSNVVERLTRKHSFKSMPSVRFHYVNESDIFKVAVTFDENA